MPTDPSASLSIDIRICGNIPRHEMSGFFGGAPASRSTLPSRRHALNASGLAETNGSPTLHKISICDAGKKALSDLIFQRSEAMKQTPGQQHGQVLQNVIPFDLVIPPWAVTARGESVLEVSFPFSYLMIGVVSQICFLRCPSARLRIAWCPIEC